MDADSSAQPSWLTRVNASFPERLASRELLQTWTSKAASALLALLPILQPEPQHLLQLTSMSAGGMGVTGPEVATFARHWLATDSSPLACKLRTLVAFALYVSYLRVHNGLRLTFSFARQDLAQPLSP